MKVGIVVYQQSIEVSPSIKGLACFFERQNVKYKILVDELYLSRSVGNDFSIESLIPDFPLPQYKGKGVFTRIFNKLSRIFLKKLSKRKRYFDKKLSTRINQEKFDLIVACEFEALLSVYKSGFDLSKVVYFSLELEHVMRSYPVTFCAELISACEFCIIQSEERASDLTKYLNCDLNFKYVPVSVVPIDIDFKPVRLSERIKIVYSGYFADWAGVLELAEAFIALKDPQLELTLHGHCPDSKIYIEQIKAVVKNHKNITFNFDYMDDKEHLAFLASNNIGIAYYNNPENSPNWDNLLYSSGKIASYLWAGLAVITNCTNRDNGPFLAVPNMDVRYFKKAIDKYRAEQENMQHAAIDLAKKDYNILNYYEKIFCLKIRRKEDYISG